LILHTGVLNVVIHCALNCHPKNLQTDIETVDTVRIGHLFMRRV
jgi:hypothetical protein